MGAIVGGLIGGIGSIAGSLISAHGASNAAKQALTGYNYLNSNPLIKQLQTGGSAGATGEANTTGAINQLLTSPDQNNPAFQNYLNSSGYNFQRQQGTDAITGSAAAKGLLNSGATARALTDYGQNLASTSFNNYLGQLHSLGGLYSDQAARGLASADAVGQAGTTGGGNAGVQTAAGANSIGSGVTNAFNLVGGGVQSLMGSSNPFSGAANGANPAPSFLGG